MHLLFGLCLMLPPPASSQVLRDNNFSYLYNPDEPFSVGTICYRENEKLYFYFSFSIKGTRNISEFGFGAELRESLSAKEGTPLPDPEWLVHTEASRCGRILLPEGSVGRVAVLRITLAAARKPWLVYTPVPEKNAFALLRNNQPVVEKYISINQPVTFAGFNPGKPLIVSVYRTDFPPAAPPFSETQGRVPPRIIPDEIFSHNPSEPLSFSKAGLVLVQQDTASTEGLAFRVEDDYPRFTTLSSLAGPMIYICQKKEIDRLYVSAGSKPDFDKTILSILGNAERAKIFMRSYFQRVEQTNRMFTSYKAGWKTDRGMIYIIFGPPDEVYLADNREIWEYRQPTHKERFTFVRASTLFDPDNFVLLREGRYRNTWYEVVDLWRKARF